MATSFSDLLSRSPSVDGRLSIELPEDWLQGRTAYGGLQTALALAAMRSVAGDRPVRSLQSNFIGPLAGKVEAKATLLRVGKNVAQIEARLMGEQGLAAQVVGVFGAARPSSIALDPEQPQVSCDEPTRFPYLPGVTPSFTQHLSIDLLRGSLPFSGRATASTSLELALEDSGAYSELHLPIFADVVYPLALCGLSAPTFGSTLSWLLEFLPTAPTAAPLSGWRLDTDLLAARDGYSHQSSVLWAPSGAAAALSRQTMIVFD